MVSAMRYPILAALLRRTGDPSIAAFCKRSGVARSFLYEHAADPALTMQRGPAERIARATGIGIDELAKLFRVEDVS